MQEILSQEKVGIKELLHDLSQGCKLVVHNDQINTFDWVIESLVEICNHSWEQAEQCAMLIHFKGRYSVKEGERDTLLSMKTALTDRGINATVED